MTIVSPMGQLRPVFADKNGKRLSGGKVFTYEPGTLTPKSTYTDALNLIPNTNPINLDESGEADIYLYGSYRMQVYDRYGVLIQDVDNFRTWASGIPAESILYGNQDLEQFNAGIESSLNNRYTKEETYNKAEVDASLNSIAGGHKAYQTLAEAQTAQAFLPANTIVEVTNDPTASNNGTYQWNGTTLTKSAYDPLTQSNSYTDLKTINISADLIDLQNKSMNGGTYYYAQGTSLFTFSGYVNTAGVFISSGAGYTATDFIPIAKGVIKSSLNAGSSVASVAFYDKDKQFISGLAGNNLNTERSITVPSNATFARFTNLPANNASPYSFTLFDPLLDDPSLIKKDELTIEYSQNLAKPSLIVDGAYVNSSGSLTTAAGWKYIKIPVEAGEAYTFGNFSIDSAGYYVFFTAANGQIAGSNGNFQNTNLPKTLVAPTEAGYLLFDIARPANTPEQYAQLTINKGAELIDYVEPIDVVTKIAGYKLKGSDAGGSTPVPENVVLQGGNATLADIIADSVTTGALIANLPTSSAGLETGQAYIDTATATIKVVM